MRVRKIAFSCTLEQWILFQVYVFAWRLSRPDAKLRSRIQWEPVSSCETYHNLNNPIHNATWVYFFVSNASCVPLWFCFVTLFFVLFCFCFISCYGPAAIHPTLDLSFLPAKHTLDPWILKTLDPLFQTGKTLDPGSKGSKVSLDRMTPWCFYYYPHGIT